MEGKEKLNILIFSWRGPGHPNAGGAEIVTHEYAKGWIKVGYTVTLFTSIFRGAKSEEIVDGVNILRRGSQTFGVHLAAFKWYMFGKHPKYDLIIDQFHGVPFFTPLFVKEKKLAFIHEVAKGVWKLNPWSKPFNLIPAVIGTLFEPLMFKLFYRSIPFMTVSNSSKKDLVNWDIPEDNITVIINGINIPKLKSFPSKEKKKTLIFLGALSKDKGIETALKVFSFINSIKTDWQFWVVGKTDSKYLIELEASCRKLGIDKKTKFFGFVSEREKFRLLSRAHIAINPSIHEGWGLVVIEAAAMGTPTVAFDVSGLKDSILNGKTGIIDKQHSVKSMAFEIIDLLNDGDRYQRMRAEALRWSKRFSWKKSIIKSFDLINKIMKNSNY